MDHFKPDILAITETWGRPALTDALLTPSGYSLFRKDRQDRLGGDVTMFIRSQLVPVAYVIPDVLNKFEDSVWAVVQVSFTKTLLFGCIYRSPTSVPDNDARLVSLLDFVGRAHCDYCLIGGDFNAPDINWMSMDSPPSSRFLLDCTLDNYFSQLVMSPTRGSNTLDLVFVNDTTFVSGISTIEEFPGSDHKSVTCFLTFDTSLPHPSNNFLSSSSKKFNFNKADWQRYRSFLAAISCDDILASNNIDVVWSRLKSSILAAAENSIPRMTSSRRLQGVPLSGEVRLAFRSRNRVFRQLRGSNSFLASKLRTEADEKLNRALLDARSIFERDIANTCTINPKRFWSHIRSALGSKPKVSSVIDGSGILTRDDDSTAEAFNAFFASIFTAEPTDTLPTLLPRTNLELNDFPISVESVHKVIKRLSNHSSPGPDGVSNPLLKEGGVSLIMLLVPFFRLILDKGILPAEWKVAIVTPIFKKGSRTDCKNFRPISLTCTLCKVFESLIKDAILTFLLDL